MIIVRMMGGLGNQMFQYALYRALFAHGKEAAVDTSWFDFHDVHNGLEIHTVFGLSLAMPPLDKLKALGEDMSSIFWRAVHKYIRHKPTFYAKYGVEAVGYFPEVFNFDEKYLSGYWQNERYFRGIADELRSFYSFPVLIEEKNVRAAEEMARAESVSVHVRLGDYQNEPLLQGICDEGYYARAIARVKEEVEHPRFFVFSNDLVWCRAYLDVEDAVFVDWNQAEKSYRDMQLMSLCKHHIVANSSFSWWGAWLAHSGGLAIAPKSWMNDVSCKTEDMSPADWVTI